MSRPKVVIIILQYNNSQDTIRCLNSVKEFDYANYNIITVDNASNSKDFNNLRFFIESVKDPNLTLMPSEQNLGYAGGNNLGIKQAIENGSDYVFILNPDTIVEKNTLTKLIEAGESNSKIGILGPAIDEGQHTIYGGKIGWLKPELAHNEIKPITYNPKPKIYVIGAAMLIKRQVIEKIGLLNERYFLYFEDADYCVRAMRSGYQMALASEVKVTHDVSASTSQLGSALLLRYHFRNAHLFNWKNGPWYIKLALPFWSIFIIIKQLIKLAFAPSKREVSRSILTGVIDFYKNKLGKINV